MALDKQSILNELGSVMNKLQSADCGCMGKLFSNQNGGEGASAMGGTPNGGCGSFGGCRGGCCHHGHGGHCGFNFGHGGGRFGAGAGEPCMGSCNPRKMYAETYNYLNSNLMQPVVNEVYNDLKSLTPENTVTNNSAMAAKMGLSPQGNMQGGNSMQGNNGMQDSNLMSGGNPMQGGNPMLGGNPMHGGNMQGNAMYGSNQMQGSNNLDVNYMQGGNAMYGGNTMQGMTPTQNSMQPSGVGYQDTMQSNNSSPHNPMHGTGFVGDMANQNVQQMMGGMGPNIMDMMKSGGKSKPTSGQMPSGQMPSGQMPSGQMLIDAPQSPHGKVGVTPLNATGGMYYNAESGMSNNPNQQMFTQPTTQYVSGSNMNSSGFIANQQNNPAMNANMPQGHSNQMQQSLTSPNMQTGANNPYMNQAIPNPHMLQGQANPNMHQDVTNANAQNGLIYSNATPKQISQPGNRNYGMHNQGMQKFNEMFPGVMGKDLGFDPMAIAIQMNPENHQKAAMDTMAKMMNGKMGNMNKAMDGANAAVKALSPQQAALTNQGNVVPSDQQALTGQPGTTPPMSQTQQYDNTVTPTAHQIPQQQQQVYNATTPNQAAYNAGQVVNQGQVLPQQQYQYQQQQVLDPNTGALVQQNVDQGGAEQPNTQQEKIAEPTYEAQLMIQDPIFPADTSKPFNAPLSMRRQKFYQYNTLGQPVELLPAKMFHSAPETNFQQTLYPQPASGKLRKDISKLNIKSTVSKTSIMANKPGGSTPSRSNLQNIYHQYKGSHSSTFQNIRNPVAQSDTHSEGKIGGVQRVNIAPAQQAPVEKVGGDTANNQTARTLAPVKESIQEHGDIAGANKPHGDNTPVKEPPKMMGNTRKNGLQDQVYTSYQTSAAWSFHGEGGTPYYGGYRGFRARS